MDYNEYIGPIPGKIHNLGSADTDLKTLLGYTGNPVDVSALNDGRSLPEVTVVRINGNDYSLGDMLKGPLERLLGYIRDTVPTAGISEGQIIYTKDDHKLKVCNQVGKKEEDTLTVTVGSTGAGDLTITLNGVNTTVAVGASKTADEIATAICAASFPGGRCRGLRIRPYSQRTKSESCQRLKLLLVILPLQASLSELQPVTRLRSIGKSYDTFRASRLCFVPNEQ